MFSVFLYEELYPSVYYNWIPIIHLPFVTERRQAEANRIREKYPDRIPVSFYSCWCILLTFSRSMWSHSNWLSCDTGHCWEGREKRYPRHWQEKVSPFLSILRIIPLHFYCLNGFLSWQYNFCASETIACSYFLLFYFKLLILQNCWFLAQPWALPLWQSSLQSCIYL